MEKKLKTIVIYNSKTGFTEKYARMIAEKTGCECVPLKKAGKMNLYEFDSIVFGSWVMGGIVTKLGWLLKRLSRLSSGGKKIFAYAVGMLPAGDRTAQKVWEQNLSESERSLVRTYYFEGGLNYEKMNGFTRFFMKKLGESMAPKQKPTEVEKIVVELFGKSHDNTDERYIQDLVRELLCQGSPL